MKKILFCLLFSTIFLTSCTLEDSQSTNKSSDNSTLTEEVTQNSNDSPKPKDTTTILDNANTSQDKEKEVSKDSSKEISPTETSGKNEGSKTNISPGVSKVKGKVQLYEDTFFDDRRFGENIPKNFCEVVISNLTETSFDFMVYEVTDAKNDDKKVIFLKNTAVFRDDGTKATFYGKTYTLNFIFPNNHGANSVVTDMKISGFEPLEGKTYCNNKIPVQEYYDLIKEAWQKEKDYIDSIDDPKVKQSVQTTFSAAIMESCGLLMEHPEDSNAIDGSLRKVLAGD
ncbi:hypothetical protein J1C67_07455 [Clostridium gasigenes]|uniref:hypothetical protein n=1 Tax=Clostridium gasigenes TaxID=94869 RepID=UPI001438522E|nr:hypothetical protein [Clostridium gasigenes]NKF06723.1 hypothetical protein [Clostridium gasigenes]QSW20929.1 hypothetical protein J1C67_07455 [Clostridium gasigenes]